MAIKSDYLSNFLSSDNFFAVAKSKINDSCHNDFALVMLDFDNFNFINDFFGYGVGDSALSKLTEYFASQLHCGEIFSRLHADHFAFLVKIENERSVIERFTCLADIKDVLAGILPPHYNIICSGGIVYVGDGHESLSSLSDKANFARKQAKGNHLSTILLYDKNMAEDLEWRKIITLTMESALQEHEFEMYLQPKIMIKTKQVVGAEALVRWKSKKYGTIYPDKFIPILEQNGFIIELDFYMLEQACIFLSDCMSKGIAPRPISVNFSKMHIRSGNFAERVFSVVNSYDVPARLIEIEFTESVFISDFNVLVNISTALKGFGFRVSLDDFGSAYSSLNYLKDLPLDIIKIDKAFLGSKSNSKKGRIIIEKVVEMIKSLNMVALIEGVETTEQVGFLQGLNCDLAQGFFYSKPIPVCAYMEFVQPAIPCIAR